MAAQKPRFADSIIAWGLRRHVAPCRRFRTVTFGIGHRGLDPDPASSARDSFIHGPAAPTLAWPTACRFVDGGERGQCRQPFPAQRCGDHRELADDRGLSRWARMIAFVTAAISTYSSTSGVVLPAFCASCSRAWWRAGSARFPSPRNPPRATPSSRRPAQRRCGIPSDAASLSPASTRGRTRSTREFSASGRSVHR